VTARQDARPLKNATGERENLLHIFKQLVIPLGCSLPSSSEVVLHDLSKLPDSIIAIYGEVTGREVGDPATDKLLRSLVSDNVETVVNYETQLKDGRKLQSSTIVIRDFGGEPIAALCINSDVSVWHTIQEIAGSMIPSTPRSESSPHKKTDALETAPEAAPTREADGSENFVQDVDELAALLIKQAIQASAVPVELMRKHHKVEVVRTLKSNGMFLLKDAVDMIAEALDVSRFTIYNYVNEIERSEETRE
jgi:predicted transcriptional regulator YheO